MVLRDHQGSGAPLKGLGFFYHVQLLKALKTRQEEEGMGNG
jgi:hypothetical protein